MLAISLKHGIVIAVFALVALFGLSVSYAAPYVASSDELVYLTGALQAKERNLPDAYMLQGMDFGPYLYPKILLAQYESLDHDTFKSIYLIILVTVTGLSAYAMFRLIGLSWTPSLLLSVVALMPRFASGQEIFGVLTFKEAIGRSGALPLFFLGTGFLIRRMTEGKSLWPLFGIFGLLLFLHPVTIMLFVFISLVAVAVTRAFQRTSVRTILQEAALSGAAFVLAGSYFFVEVLKRLAHGVTVNGVQTIQYVQAITFRNAWEFPAESLKWYPHMAIVSTLFVGMLVLCHTVPVLRSFRARFQIPQAQALTVWGITVALGALFFSVVLPGLNLYFMEHMDAPYLFQQWSRIAKFYYLGLFIALVPVVYALWERYRESQWHFKTVVLALLVTAGILSSSFAFEIAQFVIGYKNFEKAYIPQVLSHIPDDTTPAEYRETCKALTDLGATSAELIVSPDFAFRYYCRAHLYVTNEEGSAYQQLQRIDVVAWYARYLAQRAVLASADLFAMLAFAERINADFIVVSRTPKFAALETTKERAIVMTTRHIIVKVSK